MNIDEYRAMVAQEAQQADNPKGDVTDVQTNENTTALPEQAVQTTTETSITPTHAVAETEAPQTVSINGVEVSISEVEQGFLRQADYTKKTQELSRIKEQTEIASQYYEAIQTDPEFAEGIATRFGLPFMTKEEARSKELENELNTLRIERDIEALKSKHGDIDVQAVLQTAYEKRLPNLEDAYLLIKAQNNNTPDIDTMKEQIRQELLRDLQSNVDTSTIIGTGGNTKQVQSNVPELTAAEIKVAQNMGMTATDYAKWKNMK